MIQCEQQIQLESHQLISFVLVKKQRLLQRPSDVRVSGNSLEVGGGKLRELVVRQILLFFIGQRQSFIQQLLFSFLTVRSVLQVLRGGNGQKVMMKKVSYRDTSEPDVKTEVETSKR